MAKKLILEFAPHIPVGNIKLTFPEGDVHEFKGKKEGVSADLHIISQNGLLRIIKDGKMDFCEAYMAGEVNRKRLSI